MIAAIKRALAKAFTDDEVEVDDGVPRMHIRGRSYERWPADSSTSGVRKAVTPEDVMRQHLDQRWGKDKAS